MIVDEDMLRRLELDQEHPEGGSRPLRVMIYSHDAQGLGHLRRNILISRSLLAEDLRPSVLLISGLRETAAYDLPHGVDSITLPSLGKAPDGSYYSRSLRIDIDHLVKVRSSMIRAAAAEFRPDVLIVDKLPNGIFGELRPTLAYLRKKTSARIILGLRDILDEPEAVRREWERDRCTESIVSHYDRVWIYGDQNVYDAAAEYGWPAEVSDKIRYTGYLNPRHVSAVRQGTGPGRSALSAVGDLHQGPLTLCLIGGGRDGLPLASTFLQSALPEGGGGVLVTGPLMESEDRAMLHAMLASRPSYRLIEFVNDPQPLLCCADRVICMGGYNTVCEVLAFQKRALIIPRVTPRREQVIRAERLGALGLVDILHPGDLSAEALSRWINAPAGQQTAAESVLAFNGVQQLPGLFMEAVDHAMPSAHLPDACVSDDEAAPHV